MTSPLPKKTMDRWKKVLLIVACTLLGLILLVCSALGILWLCGRRALLSKPGDVVLSPPAGYDVTIDDDASVVYNGKRYCYNSDVTAIVCMGTDRTEDLVTIGNGYGQADTLFLVAIDTKSGKITIINVSRDILAEIDVYDENGEFLSIERHQICLAHAYGNSRENACNNTVTAVSRLFYGIPINTYFAIDWSSIPLLTQSVGGVVVPAYDKEWNPIDGTVTLSGADAIQYLKGRRSDIINANLGRMERQVSYLKSLASKAIEISRSTPTFPITLFETLSDHSTSNLDVSRITYLSCVFLDNGAQLDFRSVAGEVSMGEKFAEMHVDQTALFEMVLEVFFKPIP